MLTYLGLSLINWDHFGNDARTAYSTGHSAAIDYARQAGSSWDVAYAMNAFADHYLQDLFSAGHLRNPRRDLHGILAKDRCSQVFSLLAPKFEWNGSGQVLANSDRKCMTRNAQ